MFLAASLKLSGSQEVRNAVGWTMHLALASRGSSTVPPSGTDIFPLSSFPSLGWSNTIRAEKKSHPGLHSHISTPLQLQLWKENQPWCLTRVCKRVAHRCTNWGREWLGKLPKEGLAVFREETSMHNWGLQLQWAWCSGAQEQHGRDQGTYTCRKLQMRQRRGVYRINKYNISTCCLCSEPTVHDGGRV